MFPTEPFGVTRAFAVGRASTGTVEGLGLRCVGFGRGHALDSTENAGGSHDRRNKTRMMPSTAPRPHTLYRPTYYTQNR